MNEDIKLNFTTDQPELIIRTGAAMPVKEPKQLSINGADIEAVHNYIKSRIADSELTGAPSEHQQVNANSIVIINRNENSITLHTDPNNVYGTTITGSIVQNKHLSAFKINQAHYRTKDEMVKLLRFNKSHFANQDEYSSLLLKLKSMRVKTKGEMEDTKDTRGNKTISYDKQVTSDLPPGFLLFMPLFEGPENGEGAKRSFMVEIAFEEYEGNIRFWLESPELAELIEQSSNYILATQAELIDNLFVLCIWR